MNGIYSSENETNDEPSQKSSQNSDTTIVGKGINGIDHTEKNEEIKLGNNKFIDVKNKFIFLRSSKKIVIHFSLTLRTYSITACRS